MGIFPIFPPSEHYVQEYTQRAETVLAMSCSLKCLLPLLQFPRCFYEQGPLTALTAVCPFDVETEGGSGRMARLRI